MTSHVWQSANNMSVSVILWRPICDNQLTIWVFQSYFDVTCVTISYQYECFSHTMTSHVWQSANNMSVSVILWRHMCNNQLTIWVFQSYYDGHFLWCDLPEARTVKEDWQLQVRFDRGCSLTVTLLVLIKLTKFAVALRLRYGCVAIPVNWFFYIMLPFFAKFKNAVHSLKPAETPSNSASHQAQNYVQHS